MRLGSEPRGYVDLALVGYEFPDAVATGSEWDWDANWLIVDGSVRETDGRAWRFSGADLTTWEVTELGRWLRGIRELEVSSATSDATGRESRQLAFTEPSLGFNLIGRSNDEVRIGIHLEFDARPPETDEAWGDFVVVVTMTASELDRAIDDWALECAAWPKR